MFSDVLVSVDVVICLSSLSRRSRCRQHARSFFITQVIVSTRNVNLLGAKLFQPEAILWRENNTPRPATGCSGHAVHHPGHGKHIDNTPWPAAGCPCHFVVYPSNSTNAQRQYAPAQVFSV